MNWLLPFMALNVVDAGITCTLLAVGCPVEEANPLVQRAIEAAGWYGFWTYKLIVPLILAGAVYVCFNEVKAKRIMKWATLGIAAIMTYMICLAVWAIALL